LTSTTDLPRFDLDGQAILALVADNHSYHAGLPRLFELFRRHRINHLACLGDCDPEPFSQWLEMAPEHRLYWIYDVDGSDLLPATGSGLALELEGRIFLAHTRATAFDYFKPQINAYRQAPPSGRPPLLVCHGHTHTPCVIRYDRTLNHHLYIHSAVRPYLFRPRRELFHLERDLVYLIVPGAFINVGQYLTLSFAVLDLERHLLEMISLTDLERLDSLELSLASVLPERPGQ
jgi:predicted phosphodiesterase